MDCQYSSAGFVVWYRICNAGFVINDRKRDSSVTEIWKTFAGNANEIVKATRYDDGFIFSIFLPRKRKISKVYCFTANRRGNLWKWIFGITKLKNTGTQVLKVSVCFFLLSTDNNFWITIKFPVQWFLY